MKLHQYDDYGIDYYYCKRKRILGDLTDKIYEHFSLHRQIKNFYKRI